jgi:hypothetical protein
LLIIGDQSVKVEQLVPRKTRAGMERDRLDPKFGRVPMAFSMHMRRLMTIGRIEKESIRTGAQNCRHDSEFD